MWAPSSVFLCTRLFLRECVCGMCTMHINLTWYVSSCRHCKLFSENYFRTEDVQVSVKLVQCYRTWNASILPQVPIYSNKSTSFKVSLLCNVKTTALGLNAKLYVVQRHDYPNGLTLWWAVQELFDVDCIVVIIIKFWPLVDCGYS